MDEQRCTTVAINSKTLAEAYVKKKNYGRAFSHFLIAVKLNPAWKVDLKETLSAVLYKWGAVLEKEGRYDDLFKCYEQAIEVYPDNEYILNNLGALLLKYGLIKEAAHYFRKSLNIRPHFLRALRNLENVSNLVVQRWHFRMLNDSKRNGAFREAIRKKVKRGFDTVLDIGTGTGILSLFALEAGARIVCACDSSPYMTEITTQVLRENKATCIELKCKHSSDLKIPDDVPERIKLVVTEIVDCGLLGEHILDTLIDAWDRLLLPSSRDQTSSAASGAVIPLGATVFVVGVECDTIRRKHFPAETAIKSFNFNDCRVRCIDESYDSESLNAIRNGFKYLTNVYKTAFINFNDSDSMKRIVAGERKENVVLKCSENGRVDCLIVWFDLHVDEDIILSTAPDSESCESWDQAIFVAPDDFTVAKDDLITVTMNFTNNKLSFHSFSTNRNRLYENELISNEPVFHPSQDVMKLLNSVSYNNCFSEMSDIIEKKYEQGISILDAFPFPVFGLTYLLHKRDERHLLTCVVRRESDRDFLKFLAHKYAVGNQIRFIDEEEMWESEELGKFDIILLHLIEYSGELRDKIIVHLDTIRSHLKRNGMMLPEKVTVMGQLIESEWLEIMSRIINDDMTFGYRIGKFINSYQVNSHIDFNLNSISHIPRSEPFELCTVVPNQYSSIVNISAVRPGSVNAVAYWFRVKFMSEVSEINTLHDCMTNQSALLFPRIQISASVELKIVYDTGLFRIDNL